MSIKEILREQKKLIKPEKETINEIKTVAREITDILQKELVKYNVQIFLGGSFAKNTILKKDMYDVDLFVRFDWKYDNISDLLEKAVKKVCNKLRYGIERIHGSRDYFRIILNKNFYFEVIPVTKISKPNQARNVTDLSYFHVSYLKRKGKGLEEEIRIAKHFCQSVGVYGAESYIQGFSGYGLECLMIYFKSFDKMLKELLKIKIGERIVIDIEKKYKNKDEALFELNESKLNSPIILIDPTYKERNVLACLSRKTFEKFQEKASEFIKNPSKKIFENSSYNPDKFRKSKDKEFVEVTIESDRQAGDIAGTKMKKFYNFFEKEIQKYFHLSESDFLYQEKENVSKAYFLAKRKAKIIKIGPPLEMKEAVKAFKLANKNTYTKGKFIHANIDFKLSLKEFISQWIQINKIKMNEMAIKEITLT